MKGDIVIIDWLDSNGDNTAWCTPTEDDGFGPVECRSTGIVLEDNRKYIAITMSINTNAGGNQCGFRLAIPKVAIMKLTKVKLASAGQHVRREQNHRGQRGPSARRGKGQVRHVRER